MADLKTQNDERIKVLIDKYKSHDYPLTPKRRELKINTSRTMKKTNYFTELKRNVPRKHLHRKSMVIQGDLPSSKYFAIIYGIRALLFLRNFF